MDKDTVQKILMLGIFKNIFLKATAYLLYIYIYLYFDADSVQLQHHGQHSAADYPILISYFHQT